MATTAETLRNFIDGEPVAHEGETEPVLNPATGEELARAPRSSAADVERAVAAARRAWRRSMRASRSKRSRPTRSP
jgi:acyl-CoA reductase-like NAD-dependent aldehyde dehydrogenase